MKTFHTLFLSAALAVSIVNGQQNPQPSPAAPAASDAQIQALQEQIKALQLQQQIAALQKQQQTLTQPKPGLPPCDAAPTASPKPNSWVERMKRKAEAAVAKQAGIAGGKIAKATHGTIDGSVMPDAQDIAGAVPKSKPCTPVASATPVNAQSK